MGAKVGREDLLHQLMQASLENPHKFGEEDVFAVATGAILAGADSTASTTQSFIHHILRSPSIHHHLLSEILHAHSSSFLSYPHPQWEELQGLPYFQACLRETMRLRPAIGLPMTRRIPSSGALIDGTRIPGSVVVGVNSWVVHRDRSIFGDDADIFRPERWLLQNSSEEKVRYMEKHMFQFGGGSHLCIGRHLALLEMNKVLCMLVRDWEMELVRPEKELEYRSFFFISQRGLDVRLRRRKLEMPVLMKDDGLGRGEEGEKGDEKVEERKMPWKQDIGNGRLRWKTDVFG